MSTGSDADPDGEPRDGRDGGQDSGRDGRRDGERERELGDFLRSRRAAIDPADVGLPSGPRRRAPGLRREEVALLAGVSVTWYTWLEQGRAERPSRAVLDAVARALRLDDAEHSHLLTLARRAAGDGAVDFGEVVGPWFEADVERQESGSSGVHEVSECRRWTF